MPFYEDEDLNNQYLHIIYIYIKQIFSLSTLVSVTNKNLKKMLEAFLQSNSSAKKKNHLLKIQENTLC